MGDSIQTVKRLCGSSACRLQDKHPDWSMGDCQTIAKRQIRIGFSEEQAIAAWGRPDDINRTVGQWGSHEQWVYERGDYEMQYLYFENGVLTSFQD